MRGGEPAASEETERRQHVKMIETVPPDTADATSERKPMNRFRDARWALFAACALPVGLVVQGCGDGNGSQQPEAPSGEGPCGCAGTGHPDFDATTEAGADAPGEASEAPGPEAGDAGGGTNDADVAVDAGADSAMDAGPADASAE